MESDERIVEQCQQGRSSGFSLLLLAYQAVKTYRFRARRTLRTELTARGGWA